MAVIVADTPAAPVQLVAAVAIIVDHMASAVARAVSAVVTMVRRAR